MVPFCQLHKIDKLVMSYILKPQIRLSRVGLRSGSTLPVKCQAQVVFKTNKTENVPKDPYQALKGVKIERVSDGQEVELVEQWEKDEIAVVSFARHFGCPFCLEMATQLQRDLLPKLQDLNVKLFLVGIGPRSNALDFVESSGFPADLLFADKDSICYDVLNTQVGFGPEKFFSTFTDRIFKDQAKDIRETLPSYKFSSPPRVEQVAIQGGLWVVKGEETKWLWYDKSVGDHADFDEILATVQSALNE